MTTTKAATKRAERERRRANGEKRVECWVGPEVIAALREESVRRGTSMAEVIQWRLVAIVF